IFVTDQEVEYSFSEDLKQFRMSQKDFTNHILKKFNKTLYEWKEDVIRPKLALQKLCRPLVVIDDADLQKAFESKYGPKVQCRMIVIQKGDVHRWEIQQRACRSEADFDDLAAKQFIPNLAAQHGRLPEPIHKHFGEPIEQKAFALKVGQVSELIEMKDGTFIILRCDAQIPADQTKQFAQERERLYREIFEGKLGQKMQDHFSELKRQAHPRNLIAQRNPTEAESAIENVSGSQGAQGSQQSKK